MDKKKNSSKFYTLNEEEKEKQAVKSKIVQPKDAYP